MTELRTLDTGLETSARLRDLVVDGEPKTEAEEIVGCLESRVRRHRQQLDALNLRHGDE